MDQIAEMLEKIQEDQLENSLEDESITDKQDLLDQTRREGFPNSMMVYTSGSTGEPTPVPYHRDYISHTLETNARALKLAGMTQEDVELNLGAMFPHISGWAFRESAQKLGAEVANHSFNDFKQAESILEEIEDYKNDVSCVVGLPRVVNSLGESIEEEVGEEDVKPADIFETMEKGFFVGDMLTEGIRQDLKGQWGLEETREIYGSTETDIIACAIDETRDLVPMLDSYIFELVPDDEDRIEDIRDVEQKTTGRLVITDPYRVAIDQTRYELGDRVEVIPDEEIPRIRVLGRDKTTLNLGGALVYEESITNAAGEGWRAVKYEGDENDLYVDLYVPDVDNFEIEALYESAPAVKEVNDLNVVEDINVYPRSDYNRSDTGENKERRIVDKTSLA